MPLKLPGLALSDDQVFQHLNGVVVAWIFLIFFPKFRFTKKIALLTAAYYSGIYSILAIQIFGQSKEKIDFFTLDGIVKAFSNRSNVLVGWTHYIAFDLMVGRFIVQDAEENKMPHLAIIWCLPLTLMLGPMGLFSYLTFKTMYLKLAGKAKESKKRR